MSGWIKMGVHLRTHPKVVRMASALRADRLRVVGGLWAVWCIFDAHTDDGLLEGYTLQAIDDDLGWKGFASAMQSIGWLEVCDGGLLAPDYDEHNGPSAKRRASETKRKAESRQEASDDRTKAERIADNKRKKSGQMSASDADTLRAREEKRREEEKEEHTPPASRVPPGRRGSRLPPDWTPGDSGFAFASQHGLANGKAHAELERFRDHWAAKTGQGATKADWQAAWRNWVRKAVEFAPRGAAAQPDTTPSGPWHSTLGGVKAKGQQVGVPYTAEDECRPFSAYKARVLRAVQGVTA